MEPIISPWFIYAFGLAEPLKGVSGAFSWIFGLLVVSGIVACIIGEGDDDPVATRYGVWVLKRMSPVFFLLVFLWVAIPTPKILMAMYAASIATPDNIGTVVGAGKSFKDEVKQDIIDLMERGLDKPDNKGLAE